MNVKIKFKIKFMIVIPLHLRTKEKSSMIELSYRLFLAITLAIGI